MPGAGAGAGKRFLIGGQQTNLLAGMPGGALPGVDGLELLLPAADLQPGPSEILCHMMPGEPLLPASPALLHVICWPFKDALPCDTQRAPPAGFCSSPLVICCLTSARLAPQFSCLQASAVQLLLCEGLHNASIPAEVCWHHELAARLLKLSRKVIA